MPPAPLPLSSLSGRTTESPIGPLIRLALENPSLVSLAAGLVDEESLPVGAVAEGLAELLREPAAGRAALQYGTVQGHLPLREQILQALRRRRRPAPRGNEPVGGRRDRHHRLAADAGPA